MLIVNYTNAEIFIRAQKYKTSKYTNSDVKQEELHALLGLLIFAASQKDNHLAREKCSTKSFQVQYIKQQ